MTPSIQAQITSLRKFSIRKSDIRIRAERLRSAGIGLRHALLVLVGRRS